MRIRDPLYGAFQIPHRLVDVVTAPEVRRLGQVRLLNCMSPSLATLGELRRFSHSLGVFRLSLETPLGAFTADERLAFEFAIFLHDVGTPPFAHLFEYLLREHYPDWSHEAFIRSVYFRDFSLANTAGGLFGPEGPRVIKLVRRRGAYFEELVLSIVAGRHPLSKLLFGTIDLDNLDNVARMGWALGMPDLSRAVITLAKALEVDRAGELLLPRSEEENVEAWARHRAAIYEVLVSDPPTVGSQAVLFEAFGRSMRAGAIEADDARLYDEAIIEKLLAFDGTRRLVEENYLGGLPVPAFLIQWDGALQDLGLRSPDHLREVIRTAASSEWRDEFILPYVFIDRSAFRRRLCFLASDGPWTHGSDSRSVIGYLFVAGGGEVTREKAQQVCDRVTAMIRSGADRVVRINIFPLRGKGADLGQQEFTFATYRD